MAGSEVCWGSTEVAKRQTAIAINSLGMVILVGEKGAYATGQHAWEQTGSREITHPHIPASPTRSTEVHRHVRLPARAACDQALTAPSSTYPGRRSRRSSTFRELGIDRGAVAAGIDGGFLRWRQWRRSLARKRRMSHSVLRHLRTESLACIGVRPECCCYARR